MNTFTQIPSETTNVYWIYAHYEAYQFKKSKVDRDSGKWLIFEHIEDIDETWKKIKTALEKGDLGPSAKVATAKPNPNASDESIKVICVYTEDFNDTMDIDRVAQAIRKLGVENKLIYKLDRDVGKYHKDGFTNLSQEVRYSQKYEEVVAWLMEHPNDKYIKLLGKTAKSKNRYQFRRLDLSKAVYLQKIIRLKKLGFFFEKRNKIKNEEVVFIS